MLQETNLRSASYQRRWVHFCYDFDHVVRVLGHLVTDRQILFQTMFVIIFEYFVFPNMYEVNSLQRLVDIGKKR